MTKAALCFLIAVPVTGQMLKNDALILGEARTSISKRVGAPRTFYTPEDGGRHLFGDSEYRAAIGIWSPILDVYQRKSENNEFEFRLKFGFDDRDSKLHPIERLESIQIVIDRPTGYLSILADLPEASAVCQMSCLVYGDPFGNIKVIPEKPSIEEQALSLLIHNQFRSSDQAEAIQQIGITLYLDQTTWISQGRRNSPIPNWNSPVIEARITTMNGDPTLRLPHTKPEPASLLGRWPSL
jgi:hypothetical protein